MKKRFKKGLLIASLVLLAGSAVAGISNSFDVTPIATRAEEPVKTDFGPYYGDWFKIYADGYPAYDAAEGVGNPNYPNGKADIEVYLSPEFKDYENFNKETINDFLDANEGLIGAIKYILVQQVNFIQPVEKGATREENADLTKMWKEQDGLEKADVFSSSNGAGVTIFSELVDAVIEATSDNYDEKFEDYKQVMNNDDGANYRAILDDIQNGDSLYTFDDIMLFLRQILAYAAGTSIDGDSDIAARLGVTSATTANINSGLGVALKAIYDTAQVSSTESASLIENDILKIYSDACDIADNVGKQSLALIEAFVLLENTEIPMAVMTDIIGDKAIKDAVIEIFTDPNDCISTKSAEFLLEYFDNDTIYNLCDNIKFTKAEIKDAINQIEPARLMEIARNLDSHGLDVVRIILGMANDNDPLPPRSSHKRDQAHYEYEGQYNKFGTELVNTVLGNMDLMDLINAVEAVWVGEPTDPNYVADEALIYSYNYTPEGERTREGRRLYLENFINWINKDFDEIVNKIATRDASDQKETIHFEVKTPLNEQNIFCNVTFGFMPEKDFTDLKRNCKNLDDAFDLEFSFVKGMVDDIPDYSLNTLDFDLTVRPQYATNLFELIFKEDTLINDESLRLKEHLFDLLFGKTFGELKQYFAQDDLSDEIINDLKHINYETLINTFLDFNNLKEIFKGVESADSTFTNDDIIEFVSNLKWWMNKHKNYTFTYLKDSLSSILGTQLASKINDADFECFVNDIANWCSETNANNISIPVLKGLTNSEIYDFVDLLIQNNKEDVLNRIADLICRIINILPDSEDEINSTVKLDDCTIMDFYLSNGQFSFEKEPYVLDWKEILSALPLGEKLHIVLNGMISEEDKLVLADTKISIDANVSLKEGSATIHSVTYVYSENGNLVTLKGLLPEGATILDFAKITIDGHEVDHWEIKEGEHQGESLLLMPNYDVVLTPVFKDRTGSMPIFIIIIFGLLNIAAIITWYFVTLIKEKETRDDVAKKEVKAVSSEKNKFTTVIEEKFNNLKEFFKKTINKLSDKKSKVKKADKKPVEKKPNAKPVVKKSASKPVSKKPADKPVVKSEPKSEVKPVEKKPEIKPVVKKPVAKKVTAKPTVKKAIAKPVVKKSAAKPAVKKVEPKPVVKPIAEKPEVKPVVKKEITKAVTKKTTVKPTAKKVTAKPVVKKSAAKPAVKKVEPKPVVKPIAEKPEVKPVVKKETTKAVTKKTTVKPTAKKVTAKPVVKSEPKPTVTPSVKKAETKPVVKKSTSKPVSKKPARKPVTKKATVTPAVKKTEVKSTLKKTATKSATKLAAKKTTKPVAKKTTAKVSKPKTTVKKAVSKPVAVKPVAKTPVQPKPVVAPTPVTEPVVMSHKHGRGKTNNKPARPVFNIRTKVK